MSISIFGARALSVGVSIQKDAQKNNRIKKQFPDNPTVHREKRLDYGYDRRNPHVLVARKPGQAAGEVAAAVGDLRSVTFPMFREKTGFDEIDADVLDPSVAEFAGPYATDPAKMLQAKILKQAMILRGLVERTHVVNCYQALSTGVVTFKYPGLPDETIDFQFGSAGTAVTSIKRTALSGTTAPTAIWTHANALPLQNIDDLVSDIRATTDYDGSFDILMGREAWNAFRVHSTITNMLDNRRVEGGKLEMRESKEYKGTINEYDIYLIDSRYLLDTTYTNAWDPKTIAVVPREPGDIYSTEYGAPFDKPTPGASPTYLPTKYFSKMYSTEDPAVEFILVESRPIPLIKSPMHQRVQAVIS
jgi:hypothetical protein